MHVRVAVALAVLSPVLSSCGEEPVLTNDPLLLRYKFDQHRRYKTIAETNSSDGLNVLNTQAERHVFVRTSADAGYVAVTVEEERRNGTAIEDGSGLAGVTYQIYMNARGRVQRVEGLDEAIRDKYDALGAATLLESINDDVMTRMQEEWRWALPEEAVKPGDRWTDEFTIAYVDGGRLDVEAQMNLRKIEVIGRRRVAVIGLQTAQTRRARSGKVVEERKGRGELRFDAGVGAIRYYHMVLATTTTTEEHPGRRTVTVDTKIELQE